MFCIPTFIPRVPDYPCSVGSPWAIIWVSPEMHPAMYAESFGTGGIPWIPKAELQLPSNKETPFPIINAIFARGNQDFPIINASCFEGSCMRGLAIPMSDDNPKDLWMPCWISQFSTRSGGSTIYSNLRHGNTEKP